MSDRLMVLTEWVSDYFNIKASLIPLNSDCSFRYYFRVQSAERSFIVMDSYLEKESLKSFISVAKAFKKSGIRVPEIHAQHDDQGILILDDFGDRLYIHELTQANADSLYRNAFKTLTAIQSCSSSDDYHFPSFDAKLYRNEMNLFKEWYLEKELGIKLSKDDLKILEEVFDLLIADALDQPQCCVHRDYHSRNLMFIDQNQVGVLDFQDAVWGPITYDLLSLLRDCYIDWPLSQVEKWVWDFQKELSARGQLEEDNPQKFLRWFDWIGLQRHLKCLGIFARKNQRDGNPGYLLYIPRVLQYTRRVCDKYPEFIGLKKILSRIS